MLRLSYLIYTSDESLQARIFRQLHAVVRSLNSTELIARPCQNAEDHYLEACGAFIEECDLPEIRSNPDADDEERLECIVSIFKTLANKHKINISVRIEFRDTDTYDEHYHFGPDASKLKILSQVHRIRYSLLQISRCLENEPDCFDNNSLLIDAIQTLLAVRDQHTSLPNIDRVLPNRQTENWHANRIW